MARRIQTVQEFIASQPGIIRTSAFRQAGIGARDLVALINTGRLIRLKTGFYIAAEQLEHLSDYQIVVQLLPDAIICFISAAALYGLTTVIPDVIHVAVPNRGKKPQAPDYPPVDIVQHKTPLYECGQQKVQTEYGLSLIHI